MIGRFTKYAILAGFLFYILSMYTDPRNCRLIFEDYNIKNAKSTTFHPPIFPAILYAFLTL